MNQQEQDVLDPEQKDSQTLQKMTNCLKEIHMKKVLKRQWSQASHESLPGD